MAEQDYCLKKLLENRSRFADFVNVNVYQGKKVLQAEDLTLIANESGIVIIDLEGTKRTVQRRRDVVMKARLGPYFGIIASENQGKVHCAMPVREMMYDALDYTEQVRMVEEAHNKAGDKLNGADFLSHFTKEDRIIPILTLTLYYGQDRWEGPLSLYEMMGIDDGWEGTQMLREFLPDYHINLIDIRDEMAIEKYETSLQYVFKMIKYNKDKKTLYEYAKIHREELNHMDRDSKAAIFAIIGEQKRLMRVLNREKKDEEDMDVCQAMEELIEDGVELGVERGKKAGEIALIQKKYNKHMSARQAAEYLELDEDYVENVMSLFKSHPEYSVDEIAAMFVDAPEEEWLKNISRR